MTRKLRVLVDNEASWLATGYSNYGAAILSRLHATDKFEIAELGSYATQSEGEAKRLPWQFYGNMPEAYQKRELDEYNANVYSQFGGYKFEGVCLDFQPDVIINFRDSWMYQHVLQSPFKNFYYKAFMPTVDAFPQQESWVSELQDVDGLFTYNDWSLDVLRQQGGGKLHLLESAPPAAEPFFQPVASKEKHKESMGLPTDSFIVGTVMRNQKRKEIPRLIRAFKGFLNRAPKDIASKSFLYIHTTFPDIGWDLPLLLKEEGMASRVLWSYHCAKCGTVYFNLFQDARSICKRCGSFDAGFPQVKGNIAREALVPLINMFDVYVQYSVAEGAGMPQIEAAACGVPVLSTDYSAMSDICRKLKGYPIKVAEYIRETETHRYFAVPDNDDLIDKLLNFVLLPKPLQKKKAFETRQAYQKHYNYDVTAKKWEGFLDILAPKPLEQTWKSPPRLFEPRRDCPSNLKTADAIINWGIDNVLGLPEAKGSYLALRLIRDLTNGATCIPTHHYFHDMTFGGDPRYHGFGINEAFNILYEQRMKINHWERVRCGL